MLLLNFWCTHVQIKHFYTNRSLLVFTCSVYLHIDTCSVQISAVVLFWHGTMPNTICFRYMSKVSFYICIIYYFSLRMSYLPKLVYFKIIQALWDFGNFYFIDRYTTNFSHLCYKNRMYDQDQRHVWQRYYEILEGFLCNFSIALLQSLVLLWPVLKASQFWHLFGLFLILYLPEISLTQRTNFVQKLKIEFAITRSIL